MINKRGLSSVVATVLILLLTVSAVTLLAQYIIPFIYESLEGTECFEFREYFKFDESFGYNCYDKNINRYIISVRAKGENKSAENVKGFALRFIKENDAVKVDVINGSNAGDVKMFNGIMNNKLIIPRVDDYSVLSYNYSSSIEYDKVEIYAMIKGDKICDMSDVTRIEKC